MKKPEMSEGFMAKFKQHVAAGKRMKKEHHGQRPPWADQEDICHGISPQELCEEFVRWGTEVSDFLWYLYEDLYGGDPDVVDPPPPPPGKGGPS